VVFHTHVHVIPRHDGIKLGPPASKKAGTEELVDNATKIRAALDA
jgi:histidine triad (HIT) family protein